MHPMDPSSSIWNILLQQSPLVIVMGVGIYFLYQSDKAKAAMNDQWIKVVIETKDKEIAEIKVAAKLCTEKHEATQNKLEKLTMALIKMPEFDASALNTAPVRRPGIMDT